MMEVRQLIVDEENVILGGNMRYEALVKLKYTEIPENWIKRVSGWTEAQKKEFIVKDNVSFGEWDYEPLLEQYEAKDLKLFGLDVPADLLTTKEIEEKYDNENCDYPLIPMYDEKYEAVIIVCETRTELANVKSKLNITGKRQSYKNKYLGETNIITAKELLNGKSDIEPQKGK